MFYHLATISQTDAIEIYCSSLQLANKQEWRVVGMAFAKIASSEHLAGIFHSSQHWTNFDIGELQSEQLPNTLLLQLLKFSDYEYKSLLLLEELWHLFEFTNFLLKFWKMIGWDSSHSIWPLFDSTVHAQIFYGEMKYQPICHWPLSHESLSVSLALLYFANWFCF